MFSYVQGQAEKASKRAVKFRISRQKVGRLRLLANQVTESKLIFYTTQDGKNRIQLRATGGMVRLTQREMSGRFAASTDNIGLQLKDSYTDGELDVTATVKDSLTVQTEDTRRVHPSSLL